MGIMSLDRGPVVVRVTKPDGSPASGAAVVLTTRSGLPGTQVFWETRDSLSPTAGNTFTTDDTGRVHVWAERGLYRAAVSGGGSVPKDIYVEVTPPDDGGFDSKWYGWEDTHSNLLPASGYNGEVARVRMTHPNEFGVYDPSYIAYAPAPVSPGVVWEYTYEQSIGQWTFLAGAPLCLVLPHMDMPAMGGITELIPDIPLPTDGSYLFHISTGGYMKRSHSFDVFTTRGTFEVVAGDNAQTLATTQARAAPSPEIVLQNMTGSATVQVDRMTNASLRYVTQFTQPQVDYGTQNRGLLIVQPAARIY